MLLSEILNSLKYECVDFKDTEISDIVYDSRKAAPDTLFVALVGAYTDGHDYVQSAYLKGARVFLCQKKVSLSEDAVVLTVEDTRSALAHISANFFSHPDRELAVVGVTGTKGKTTVTHLIRTSLDLCGIKCGVIGTVGAYYEDNFLPTINTTPESYETHKLLRIMADAGCKAVCMEVSSLGLKSHRVDGIHFNTAVFTNLSPDHIGGAEHESFEEYAYWKKQLFSICDFAVLNKDDLFSVEIEKELACPYVTFAINENAAITADDIKNLRGDNFFGVGFTCRYNNEEFELKTALPGYFSVYNALSAAAVCLHFGVNTKDLAAALPTAKVKGRSECVDVDADFDVIIDYAHNGNSFKSIFDTIDEYEHSKIITVFGSVGDRAQLRRREMGLISGNRSDLSVITDDDPGFEDSEKIAKEIAGFVEKAGGEYIVITDRKQAVFYALERAQKGDIVLILGKGHETEQKIKGEKVHYSDHESVAEFFENKKRENKNV